jgi:nucleotide-binding universal stress UspA family protein
VDTSQQKKILIAVDGSDQALEAVRYISSVTAPDRTEIVLFHVGTGFPEVYFDMDNNPFYDSQKNSVMGWLAENQRVVGVFMEKAFNIFSDAGFPKEAIRIQTQKGRTGIMQSIIQESYQGYHAVAVGRTGMSWLKDLVTGSLAYKLFKKIRHMPTIVVGGQPSSQKMLLALDDSTEAMRAVHAVSQLAGAKGLEVTLCHVIGLPGMFRSSVGNLQSSERESDWLEYYKNKFRPIMTSAMKRLEDAGIEKNRIHQKYVCKKGNPIQVIIKTAYKDSYGSVVVGHRKAISFFQELFLGRFSTTIIKTMENIAVWVAN